MSPHSSYPSRPAPAARAAVLRLITAAVLVVPVALILLSQTKPASAGSCAEDPGNLLKNGTMAGGPPASNGDVVALYWTKFLNYGNQVHFENALNEGWDVNGSQYIWTDYGPFKAGIYQRVTNLTPGKTYHFWIVWGQTLQDTGGGNNVRTNGIDRHIGVDPTGGTNPDSANVVWSVPYTGGSGFARAEWNLYFTASGSSATFFLRAINYLTWGRDKVFFDTVCLSAAGSGTPTSTPWAAPSATPTGPTATPSATPTSTLTPTPTLTPTFTPGAPLRHVYLPDVLH
ncbi:MAG: hypothetical protein ACM3JD_06420 [Rudaea sp.]